MLKQILGVVTTRYCIAVLNLGLIFINAKALGVEGVGTIGLIWAAININVTVNSIFSGNTLVYFMHKYPVRMMLPIAMAWIFAGSAIGCGGMCFAGILPAGYEWHIYGLTVLYSAALAYSRFLLGSDDVKGFNIINLLQGGMLFFAVLFLYFAVNRRTVDAYLWGLYFTNGVALGAAIFLLLPHLRKQEGGHRPELFPVLKDMLAYGLWSSADNMAENFATRLNYFFVEHFLGRGSVGLLDAGTRIAESIWLVSRSVAYIEYNRIAKTSDRRMQEQITLRLLKYTFLALIAATAAVLLVPEHIYTHYLFSPGFTGIREVVLVLSPGIVMLGCNTILSHYFIGSGKVKYSAAASITGLAVLLAVAPFLIPAYGITGSAAASSIAFTAMAAFSFIQFRSTRRRR